MTSKNPTFTLKDSTPNAEETLAALSPDNATSVLAWLISGKVGIEDIAKAMHTDFEPIAFSGNTPKDSQAFLDKWHPFIKQCAELIHTHATYHAPSETLIEIYSETSPSLAEIIANNPAEDTLGKELNVIFTLTNPEDRQIGLRDIKLQLEGGIQAKQNHQVTKQLLQDASTPLSNRLLSQDGGAVAGNAFLWLLRGHVDLDDIHHKMIEELDAAEVTNNPQASVGAFYMKWQDLVQNMARSMLENDYYTRPERITLFDYDCENAPELSQQISQEHRSSPPNASHLTQDDRKLLHGAEQQIFYILTNDDLYQDKKNQLTSHIEIAAAKLNPRNTHLASIAEKRILH